MKHLFLIFTFFSYLTINAQMSSDKTECWYLDINDNFKKVYYDCNAEITASPSFTGNIDSLCWEMEKRFVNTLNEWRRNHGLNELQYDSDMESLLTVPWNEKQVQMGKISHGEGYNSLGNRSDRVGIGGVGECCAYNHRSDKNGVSEFFIQYKDSPPHSKILTDDDYNYISVSVLYDREKNRYYSVVNVRW